MVGRPVLPSSTKLRGEIKRLYAEGFNAPQIAKLKGFSRQYIYRVLVSLKEEFPDIINSDLRSSAPPVESGKFARNVHAQIIRAFVHYAGDSYNSKPKVYFKNFVDGVDVGCQGKFIYLRANGKRFNAVSEEKAYWKSLGFWKDVLLKLEDRLGVIIFKKGSQAFEFLYEEYETTDSVVAKDCAKRGNVWRVFHSEDGKLRLSVDWSEGTPNHETYHKRDNHVDSVTFNKHVNDILNNPQAPSFSQLSILIRDIGEANKQTAAGLGAVVDVLKTQFKAQVDPVDFEGVRPDYFG